MIVVERPLSSRIPEFRSDMYVGSNMFDVSVAGNLVEYGTGFI